MGVRFGTEKAENVVTGTLSAVDQVGTTFAPAVGKFHVAVWGATSGYVNLQYSFDDGANWLIGFDDNNGYCPSGAAATVDNIESGVVYRVICKGITGGPLSYRLSQ